MSSRILKNHVGYMIILCPIKPPYLLLNVKYPTLLPTVNSGLNHFWNFSQLWKCCQPHPTGHQWRPRSTWTRLWLVWEWGPRYTVSQWSTEVCQGFPSSLLGGSQRDEGFFFYLVNNGCAAWKFCTHLGTSWRMQPTGGLRDHRPGHQAKDYLQMKALWYTHKQAKDS